jgi:predicted NBD/HSP70 family sugar kinase
MEAHMAQPLTGSFELIKNINTACILNKIRISGSVSRADIARETGLTPATVSNITAEIIELGLIIEAERGESSGGRKPVLLSINKTACYFGSIHMGSDLVEAAVSDVEAELVSLMSSPLPDGANPELVVSTGLRLLEEAKLAAGVSTLAGIGICSHGLSRSSDGVVVFAPNLGWCNVPVGSMVESATGLPTAVENDVRAMAYAENWCGLARGVSDYVYLYVGHGIGGSIISDSELFKGQGGFAGEFGHVTIEPGGPLCSCGNRGCLQALASENAMLKRYIERKKSIGELPPDGLRFSQLLNLAKQGDSDALEEILAGVRYIGIEVGNIINTLSPSLIVINARISALSDIIMPVLNEEIGRHCIQNSRDNVNITFSELLREAPIRGAATCIIRRMFEQPKAFLKNTL